MKLRQIRGNYFKNHSNYIYYIAEKYETYDKIYLNIKLTYSFQLVHWRMVIQGIFEHIY